MPLTRVTRRSVADEVFDQIVTDVVSGELTAGQSLPGERRLAEVLGVSRPVVREALRRMAQAGLVEVRQGGATLVRDFTRSAGLDLLPRLLVGRGGLDLRVARSILEARLSVGPDVAALAAERGTPDLAPRLSAAVDALAASPDPVDMQVQALAFWDLLVDGADSVVFRLMFNSLRAAYLPALEALAPLMEAEVGRVELYTSLVAAVAAHDADQARRTATDLLAPTTAAMLSAIRDLEEER